MSVWESTFTDTPSSSLQQQQRGTTARALLQRHLPMIKSATSRCILRCCSQAITPCYALLVAIQGRLFSPALSFSFFSSRQLMTDPGECDDVTKSVFYLEILTLFVFPHLPLNKRLDYVFFRCQVACFSYILDIGIHFGPLNVDIQFKTYFCSNIMRETMRLLLRFCGAL